jgi:radical SAM protein with 4Fe4S-binding SPASM domain
MFNGDLDKTQHDRLEKLGIKADGFPYKKEKISETEMKVDASSFFYNKVFNPCWGNKIAIDIDGAIKNCLWSVEVFGNICKDDLKRMLLTGVFDRTWEMNKDKIDVCSSCECRYACPDCRAAVLCENGTMTGKTLLCTYEP